MYIAWWKFYKDFLVFSNFTEFRRGVCKAQQVKALVIYTDRLSWIPRTYREGGRLIPVSYPLPFTKSTITFEILDFQIRDAQNIEQKEKWNCQLDGSRRWVLNIISFHVTAPNWVLFFLLRLKMVQTIDTFTLPDTLTWQFTEIRKQLQSDTRMLLVRSALLNEQKSALYLTCCREKYYQKTCLLPARHLAIWLNNACTYEAITTGIQEHHQL